MKKPRVIRKLCYIAEARLLHSGGSVCLANLQGSCLHDGGSWRPMVPSLLLQSKMLSLDKLNGSVCTS